MLGLYQLHDPLVSSQSLADSCPEGDACVTAGNANEIFSYDWDLSEFDGTRLNSEFVSFLKEGD